MSSDILIYATIYIENEHKARLLHHWLNLALRLSPDCDLLLVDSCSPLQVERREGTQFFSFTDNIGHLHKCLNGKDGPRGRDGWGRAFCKGLEIAIDGGYEYVIHIEGDSLFKLPCRPIIEQMRRDNIKALTVPVQGMVRPMPGWVETGLMFFSTKYLKQIGFVRRYDWPSRRAHPTPEAVISRILGKDVKFMPWKAYRGDKNNITARNVLGMKLDWLTHCWSDIAAYDVFAESILAGPA